MAKKPAAPQKCDVTVRAAGARTPFKFALSRRGWREAHETARMLSSKHGAALVDLRCATGVLPLYTCYAGTATQSWACAISRTAGDAAPLAGLGRARRAPAKKRRR